MHEGTCQEFARPKGKIKVCNRAYGWGSHSLRSLSCIAYLANVALLPPSILQLYHFDTMAARGGRFTVSCCNPNAICLTRPVRREGGSHVPLLMPLRRCRAEHCHICLHTRPSTCSGCSKNFCRSERAVVRSRVREAEK